MAADGPEPADVLELLDRKLHGLVRFSQLARAELSPREREGLRWCWEAGSSAPLPQFHLCKSLLLFAYGAGLASELPANCNKWAWWGLPDAGFLRSRLLGRFREGGIDSPFWPRLLRRQGGVFWDVGASSNANLARASLLPWRPRKIHLFEPVPAYHADLAASWRRRYRNATLHNFGLGREAAAAAPLFLAGGSSSTYQQLHFSPSRMYLDSVGDGVWRQDREAARVEIRAAVEVWRGLGTERLALLSLNCEGCEYAVLQALADAGLLGRVDIVLVQLHTVLTEAEATEACDRATGTCGPRAVDFSIVRYCGLSQTLARTHQRVFGLPFHAFELWQLQAS